MYKKDYKYIQDMKPSVMCVKDIKNPIVLWKDLTWYHKKKMINEYLENIGVDAINDIRDYTYTGIVYNSKTKKILKLNLKKNFI